MNYWDYIDYIDEETEHHGAWGDVLYSDRYEGGGE